MYPRLAFVGVLSLAACSSAHDPVEPSDSRRDVAQEANEIADDLELAYARYFACRELPGDGAIWDGYDRECFISFVSGHLERRDELAACVREAALAFSLCGETTPCDRLPCASAILLDDNPVSELVTDSCSGHLDAESRYAFRECR